MRKLLLGALYYLVVTPAGVVLRLVHDPLTRRWNAHRSSYWIAS